MVDDSALSKILTLKDGRALGYAEFGDPAGLPIIGFHGMPGSRLMMKTLEKAAQSNGVRLIAPDRPGYGTSQADPRGSLLGYVDNIVELAAALQIDRFGVLGISG